MLNIKDVFIVSVVLGIKVLFTGSDSNIVQEAKGLARATDTVHCSFGAQYYLFHSCRAAVCTEDWTT